jgi:hypothetical protein
MTGQQLEKIMKLVMLLGYGKTEEEAIKNLIMLEVC